MLTIYVQGFDEFMNLVIDDAVEVKQATKEEGESRRSLGTFKGLKIYVQDRILMYMQVKYC